MHSQDSSVAPICRSQLQHPMGLAMGLAARARLAGDGASGVCLEAKWVSLALIRCRRGSID